jgi:hypothetical protein
VLEIQHFLLRTIEPLLVPICFLSAWGLLILIGWSMWAAARDGVKTATKMHQVPCCGCQYFTDDYRLKCTIHPSLANTEEAINCKDYQPKTNPMLY